MGMENRTCVGYIRIRGNDDVILNGQKNLIENFCKENGHQLKSIYIDCMDAASDRPDLNRLLEESNNKEFDTVLVTGISRISRITVESRSIVKKLKENGVKVYSITDGRFY